MERRRIKDMPYTSRIRIILTTVTTIDLPMRLTVIITVVMLASGTIITMIIIIPITAVLAMITADKKEPVPMTRSVQAALLGVLSRLPAQGFQTF